MIWREFKAMGTDIIITADPETKQNCLLQEAEKEIINFEKRFSRFIAGNELTQLNDQAGNNRKVSATMAELLQKIQYYHLKTRGIFDPTIISNLEVIGYNQSFDQITDQKISAKNSETNPQSLTELFQLRPRINDLKIIGTVVSRPIGLRIDLGGIGKGYIVDKISRELFAVIKNYWISAGGDIFVRGHQENNEGWDIGVQNPHQPDQNSFFINTRGKELGIATSGIIKRQGQNGNFSWNHIIDPRTGLPINNNILSVTAISANATKADIFAKTVLILGEQAGLDFINKETDSAALIFTKDKKTIFSKQAYLYLKNL